MCKRNIIRKISTRMKKLITISCIYFCMESLMRFTFVSWVKANECISWYCKNYVHNLSDALLWSLKCVELGVWSFTPIYFLFAQVIMAFWFNFIHTNSIINTRMIRRVVSIFKSTCSDYILTICCKILGTFEKRKNKRCIDTIPMKFEKKYFPSKYFFLFINFENWMFWTKTKSR